MGVWSRVLGFGLRVLGLRNLGVLHWGPDEKGSSYLESILGVPCFRKPPHIHGEILGVWEGLGGLGVLGGSGGFGFPLFFFFLGGGGGGRKPLVGSLVSPFQPKKVPSVFLG